MEKKRERERTGTPYKEGKKEYKTLCEEKKKEDDRWIKKTEEARTKGEVINKEKRKTKRVQEEIEMEE